MNIKLKNYINYFLIYTIDNNNLYLIINSIRKNLETKNENKKLYEIFDNKKMDYNKLNKKFLIYDKKYNYYNIKN
jgi:hypothetical protein